MFDESIVWAKFAEDYDTKVFSLTRFPERRKQVLDEVKGERILNMGTGSAAYLNEDLVAAGKHVVASDFCREMLDVAEKNFVHPSLEYVLADSTHLPFETGSFDSVVSVNSILPIERKNVGLMFKEAFRVLKPFGFFVAFLCSYDSAERYAKTLAGYLKFDKNQFRLNDTSGWQCFHSPISIGNEIVDAGFRSYSYERVDLDTSAEIIDLKRLYGINTSALPIYEYLLTARKI
ncbi:MAG: class I SAM-dependent methyltransferase [archaeon]